MSPTVWVPLREFPRYVINCEGVIRNGRTGRQLQTGTKHNREVINFTTYLGGRKLTQTRYVAKLVAEAFIFSGPVPPGYYVRRKDAKLAFSGISNLKIGHYKEGEQD